MPGILTLRTLMGVRVSKNNSLKLDKKKGVDEFLIRLGFIAIAAGLSYIFRNNINTILTTSFGDLGTTFKSLFAGSIG